MEHAMNALERAVMEKLMVGDHPVLNALRAQFAAAEVIVRDLTGVGFFTRFRLAGSAPRAPLPARTLAFGDVIADVEGLRHGAGFVLFIEDGFIACLEGYSYDEPWPDPEAPFRLAYTGGASRDLKALTVTA